jgi:flagellar protein FlaG
MVQEVTRKPDLPFPVDHTAQQPHATVSSPAAAGRAGHDGAPAAVDQKEVTRVIHQVSQELQKTNPELQMEVDSDLDRVIIKIVDGQSGQVIRQIPAQDLVNLAKQLKGLNGLLVEKHA